MHPDFSLQTYRDFAENRGRFAAGGKEVAVYDKEGKVSGTIPLMMSFESVVDQGFAALTGNAQFLASVAHNGGYQDATFTKRFGGDDFYRVIRKSNGWGSETNYQYDVQVARLDKVVTEAAFVPYMEDEAQLADLKGKLVLRVGGGTQQEAISDTEAKGVAGAYEFLTGGTLRFTNVIVNAPAPNDKNSASPYKAYQFQYHLRMERSADNPLPIGVLAGDSGSAAWTYNGKTGRWEFIGPAQSGGGGGFSQMRGSNAWAVKVIESYFDPTVSFVGEGPAIWSGADGKGLGRISQGKKSFEYHGLAAGKSAREATLQELEATRNLRFSGRPLRLVLAAPADMGAGSLTFENREVILTDGGRPENVLRSAGMDVKKGSRVVSELTAAAGDEWRKIGEGVLEVRGRGDNPARLNIGEGFVLLAREAGRAAEALKLVSGRAVVRLGAEGQLAHPVEFGVRGGEFDLNGCDVSWDRLPHVDSGAVISHGNPAGRKVSVFTYTGDGEFLGKLTDVNRELVSGKGMLRVVYDPAEAGFVWTLRGVVFQSGGVEVRKGHIVVEGRPTLHANGYVDPQDWQNARFSPLETERGSVFLRSGSSFTAGDHAFVSGRFEVEGGASLVVRPGSDWRGKVLFREGAVYRVPVVSEARPEVFLRVEGPMKVVLEGQMPSGAKEASPVAWLGRAASPAEAKKAIGLMSVEGSAPEGRSGKWVLKADKKGMIGAVWSESKN